MFIKDPGAPKESSWGNVISGAKASTYNAYDARSDVKTQVTRVATALRIAAKYSRSDKMVKASTATAILCDAIMTQAGVLAGVATMLGTGQLSTEDRNMVIEMGNMVMKIEETLKESGRLLLEELEEDTNERV